MDGGRDNWGRVFKLLDDNDATDVAGTGADGSAAGTMLGGSTALGRGDVNTVTSHIRAGGPGVWRSAVLALTLPVTVAASARPCGAAGTHIGVMMVDVASWSLSTGDRRVAAPGVGEVHFPMPIELDACQSLVSSDSVELNSVVRAACSIRACAACACARRGVVRLDGDAESCEGGGRRRWLPTALIASSGRSSAQVQSATTETRLGSVMR